MDVYIDRDTRIQMHTDRYTHASIQTSVYMSTRICKYADIEQKIREEMGRDKYINDKTEETMNRQNIPLNITI